MTGPRKVVLALGILGAVAILPAWFFASWCAWVFGSTAAARHAIESTPRTAATWLVGLRDPLGRRIQSRLLRDLDVRVVGSRKEIPEDSTGVWSPCGGCSGIVKQNCCVMAVSESIEWNHNLALELTTSGWEVVGESDRWCD